MSRTLPVLIALAAYWSCTTDGSDSSDVVRETLPNGGSLVRYGALPAVDAGPPLVTDAYADLKLGVLEGDPNYIFGDIRGVEAASDGTIYVLDYQASEVRAFASDGAFVEVFAASGEGPGEIREANGIFLQGDTLLWINDHGQMDIIGVSLTGEEVTRFPFPVRSYGYIWDPVWDNRGRLWRATSHSDDERRWPPETGLVESAARTYRKWYDPVTTDTDSVYMGERTGRSYISEEGGGWAYRGIPFSAGELAHVIPAGGFWHANTTSYRLVRTGEAGDTVVVIDADLPAQPVTDEDRATFVQDMVERDPESRRAAEAIAALMPDVKPILRGVFVDPDGRLWVQRVTENDAPTFYDLFTSDGDYLGSLRLMLDGVPRGPLRIRHGNIYTWYLDELDVPFVVRIPLAALTT